MADLDRLRRVAKARVTDITVAAYGAIPVAVEKVQFENVRQPKPHDFVTKPASKVATETLDALKNTIGALHEGARPAGYDRGRELLDQLAGPTGELSLATVQGARDAILARRRARSGSTEYRRAHRLIQEARDHLDPVKEGAYPRTIDGFRGGMLAAIAVAYANVSGEPMLGRMERAILKSETPKWSPTSSVFGPSASVAGSTLDAVKEVTRRSLNETADAVKELESVLSGIETWLGRLEEAREGAPYGGPDDAAELAHASGEQIRAALDAIADANRTVESWVRDL